GDPVILVGAPTAAGKSGLALAIAERFGGTVVNADSMQVYRDLEIVTARPGAAELARVPHRLYGVLDADQPCSAGRWREMALGEIAAATAAGHVPVLVGGTGLYLRALKTGLHPMPAVPGAVRTALNARLAAEGAPALHRDLAARDPETAARLAPGDSQRIVRALEILDHTGRGQSAWQAGRTAGAPPSLRFLTLLLTPPRDELYAACDARFARMLDAGAEAEVARFAGRPGAAESPLMKAVGVAPIRARLAGEIDRDRMMELGRRDTRRYAKRQLTWFRNQIVADLILETKLSENNGDEIFSFISNFLLTPA
ncbi:MAG: tRNA (adenosine(37)-N6)-dimethylallyltransferase MiaA, partial [Rhodospirillaceae bacterium]